MWRICSSLMLGAMISVALAEEPQSDDQNERMLSDEQQQLAEAALAEIAQAIAPLSDDQHLILAEAAYLLRYDGSALASW